MTDSDPLEEYRRRRDFRRTGEPSGAEGPARSAAEGCGVPPGAQGAPSPLFVVQKHRASRLHYDFRLEAGGVLKSWAIPKGPSMNPGEKRLAVATEDHPLEYARFEGVIAEGQYGAGEVIVWDIGTYRVLEADPGAPGGAPGSLEKRLAAGRVELWLEGRKLRGGFALVRAAFAGKRPSGGADNWLLIKKKDAEARPEGDILQDQPRSVLSGRTVE